MQSCPQSSKIVGHKLFFFTTQTGLQTLKSKSILENKELTVISSKFRHLIQQNNENLPYYIKFLSVRSYTGIASQFSDEGVCRTALGYTETVNFQDYVFATVECTVKALWQNSVCRLVCFRSTHFFNLQSRVAGIVSQDIYKWLLKAFFNQRGQKGGK